MAIGLQKIAVSASSNGDNQLVAAPTNPNAYYRVVAFFLQAAGTVNATFYSGPSATGTALTGAIPMSSGGPPVQAQPMPQTPHGIEGHLDTVPGQKLNLNLSAGNAVTGWLVYALMNT